jgi:hypothetical protein
MRTEFNKRLDLSSWAGWSTTPLSQIWTMSLKGCLCTISYSAPGDIWQCLKLVLIVTTESRMVVHWFLVGRGWDAVKHLTNHRTAPIIKNFPPLKCQQWQGWKNPALGRGPLWGLRSANFSVKWPKPNLLISVSLNFFFLLRLWIKCLHLF